MPINEIATHVRNYLLMAIVVTGIWFLSPVFAIGMDSVISEFQGESQMLFFLTSITLIFALGYLAYELAKPTVIPSFVLAIFVGMAARDVFAHVTNHTALLSMLITTGAVLILFGGGIETPFQQFKQSIGPILSLALIGTIINAFLFSLVLSALASWMNIVLPLPAIVLLGAAIASTDPAAIIPSFGTLFFIKPRVKHIAISESAINDVVGAVLVSIFLAIVLSGTVPESVADAYMMLLKKESLTLIIQTLSIGLSVGCIGFLFFSLWSKWKEHVQIDPGSDAALFLAIPLFSYTFATIFGGSGLLATFITGLLLQVRAHFRHVEHYFNHTIEGFMKPMMFMLLGAMVNPVELLAVAKIGIISGLIFMFVLRPLIVFITLLPFTFGKKKMSIAELLFLSFVRETGVIPAVLLITIYLSGIEGAETVMAIGLWVILLTLIVEPPLTPCIARKLGLARKKIDAPERRHVGPVAVLCSRGYSFPERMETVVKWAVAHSVENIVLLHCPEDKYSEKFITDVRSRALKLFTAMNKKLVQSGLRERTFEFLDGPGLLQDNIDALIAAGDVSIIFVGTKMLDYRLEDVKRLNVPFYFME